MTKAVFEPVPSNWERKPYFDYYFEKIKTMYNVNYHIAIRELLSMIKSLNIWFYPTFMYVIMQVVSQNKEFRMSFYDHVVDDMNRYKDVKKIKAKENTPPNFCPFSSIPWLSFESMSQDTYSESSLLFPMIRFGKYYNREDKMLIPFSVFVNHAIADGYHTAKLINEIEDLCQRSKEWLMV